MNIYSNSQQSIIKGKENETNAKLCPCALVVNIYYDEQSNTKGAFLAIFLFNYED
jgi:hypothetical protein